MNSELIALCGMNCALCSRYLALKNDVRSKGVRMTYCTGCRPRNRNCAFLKKRCQKLSNGEVTFCFECTRFPCERLRTDCSEMICCHNGFCFNCGLERLSHKKAKYRWNNQQKSKMCVWD